MASGESEPIFWVEEMPRSRRAQGSETRIIEGVREQTVITVEEAATKRRGVLGKQSPVVLAARSTTASGRGRGHPPTDFSVDGLGREDDLESLRSCATSRSHGPLSEATLELHNRARGHAKTTPPSDSADIDAYTPPPEGGWGGVKLVKQTTAMTDHAVRLLQTAEKGRWRSLRA